MEENIISCRNVTVKYGSYTALSDISFDFRRGEYLCIVGANGSGKSTLVKTLLGLVKPFSGQIEFVRHGTGYLSQQHSVRRDFPASVQEVVLSGVLGARRGILRFCPVYTKQEKLLARENAERLGIGTLMSRPFSTLSGGQMQRVLLARALCASGSFLVLDEPVNGLDPVVTDELYSVVRELNRKDGVGILMVSHDIHRAVQNATHILHLDHKILFWGTSAEYQETALYRKMGEVETCATHACTHCGAGCTASHINIFPGASHD